MSPHGSCRSARAFAIAATTTWLLLAFATSTAFGRHSSKKQLPPVEPPTVTDDPRARCEPITVPFCLGVPYNQTVMPNILDHVSQDEAGLEVQQYSSLIKIQCSRNLQLFLCSVFVPVCTILDSPIPPCRSLCLSSRDGCEGLMNRFGIPWPDNLECSKYPESGLCVNEYDAKMTASHTSTPASVFGTTGKRYSDDSRVPDDSQGPNGSRVPDDSRGPDGRDVQFVCPRRFRTEAADGNAADRGHAFRIGGVTVEDCGVPCDAFWSQEQAVAARTWVALWSALCAASCLFTSLTFAMNRRRFLYPERPMMFMSSCYLIVSACYLFGYFAGDGVACDQRDRISQGIDGERCTVLFMVSYFFSAASSVWWVVLTFAWFLAAGLKWGHEAIAANSHYFHLVAWTVPAAKTIMVLWTAEIEGDVLSGICSLAVWSNDTTVRNMALIPLVVYLVLGSGFWIAGSFSLYRIYRNSIERESTYGTEKLKKLIIRISLFSVLYMISSLSQILFLLYEHTNLSSWIISWYYTLCQDSKYELPCPFQFNSSERKPKFEVFLAKYFVSFLVGITSSVWVCSDKTVKSWQRFFARIKSNSNNPE